MNKKIIFSIIALLVILGIGIGAKMHMDNIEEQKQEIKHAEKLIAKDVMKHYEGVEEISFSDVDYNSNAGTYRFLFTINNESEKFEYDFINDDDYGEFFIDRDGIQFSYKKRENVIQKLNIKNMNVNYLVKINE